MSESPPQTDGFYGAAPDSRPQPTSANGHNSNGSQSTATAEFPPYIDDLSPHEPLSGGTLSGDSFVTELRKSTELRNDSPILDDANVAAERRPSLRDHRNCIANANANANSPDSSLPTVLPDRRKPSPGLSCEPRAPLRISTDVIPRPASAAANGFHYPSSRQSRLLNPEALAERRKALRSSRFLEDGELDDVGAFRASQWDLGYRTLETARFETRFVEILSPGDDATEDLVQCRLRHASLLQPPVYVALSYNWGDTRSEAAIVLNDVLLPVGANLEAAMRELRRRGEKLVWIDCLSINQADSSERSFHLLRSGQVFARASRVFAWLGPAGESSDAALGFLQQFDITRHANEFRSKSRTGRHAADEERLPDNLSNGRPKSRASPVNRAYRLSLPQSESTFSVFDALEKLFQRPYFERTWIIMETAVATNVEILCGTESASLQAAEEYMKLMRGPDSFSRMPQSLRTLLHFRKRESESHTGEARMSLLSALIASRPSNATDPRDKIYALLPLARDSADLVPTPNYVESPETALVNLAANIMTIHEQTALMLLACRSSTEGWALPSWTPNWTSLRDGVMPPWVTSCLDLRREKLRPYLDPPMVRNSGRTLTVPAVRLEQILSMSGQTQSLSPAHHRRLTRMHRNRLREIIVSLWDTLTDLCPIDSELWEDTRSASDELKIFALRAFLDTVVSRSCRAADIANLLYGAHRVQDWVDEYCDTCSLSSSSALPSATRRAIRSLPVYTILKVAVRCLSEFKMKIAVCGNPYESPSSSAAGSPPLASQEGATNGGGYEKTATPSADQCGASDPELSFRVVFRRAHVGDWIWRVRNCGVPVILRAAMPKGSNRFGNGHSNGYGDAKGATSNGYANVHKRSYSTANDDELPSRGSTGKYSVIGEVMLRDVEDGERHWTDGTGWIEEDFEEVEDGEEIWESIDLV